jgi:hypothetical protein
VLDKQAHTYEVYTYTQPQILNNVVLFCLVWFGFIEIGSQHGWPGALYAVQAGL